MNGKQTNYILLITFNKYQDIYLPVKNNLMYQTANTIKTSINNNTRHRPLHRTAHTGDIHSLKNISDGLLFHNLLFYNSYLVVTDTTCYVLSKITGSKITF
jgi:hypothetical protein